MTLTTEQPSAAHVLVVDDDEIIRGAAYESLTAAGFLVSEAENGLKALTALDHLRPEIILLDVMMPEMDGFATTRAIRQMAGFKSVPVLIMTALEDLGSINRAFKVGATDFITKPINWVILVARIRFMTRAVRIMQAQRQLQKELVQAQKMEAVATLTAGVAHDFNNLLQSILGASELLQMDMPTGASASRDLTNIMNAVNRGAKLVRQLLTFSRELKSEKRPIQLNDQVHQVHGLLQRTIPKMIAIECRLEDNLRWVNADTVQIEQVLMNLAINARDAMPDGGRLIIETANVSQPEPHGLIVSAKGPPEWVMFGVTDSGRGMDEQTRQRIFDPFFSTKAPNKGTGLGLSMVHGIIKNHNGRIICHSKPGEGTRFRVYLPTVEPELNNQPIEAEKTILGGKATILLVDDDDSIQHSGRRILHRAGYTLLTASGGEEALAIHKQLTSKIDLVLLDLIMPGIGGIKCLKNMKATEPQLKVIIISGDSPDEAAMQIINTHASGFLAKPYTSGQLLTTIRSVQEGGSAGMH